MSSWPLPSTTLRGSGSPAARNARAPRMTEKSPTPAAWPTSSSITWPRRGRTSLRRPPCPPPPPRAKAKHSPESAEIAQEILDYGEASAWETTFCENLLSRWRGVAY